eukprot:SM000014S00273  [mRNA]  locus=s14:454320:455246:+ [translate_table: standard]
MASVTPAAAATDLGARRFSPALASTSAVTRGPAAGPRCYVSQLVARQGPQGRPLRVSCTLARQEPQTASGRPGLPPRICTLSQFSQHTEGSRPAKAAVAGPEPEPSVVELLAASVEASAQVENLETLSGRFAMIFFAAAVGLEMATGSSIFQGIGVEKLAGILGLCLLATTSAATFAVAYRARRHVSALLATGCKNLMDSAVDRVIEGLFFEDSKVEPFTSDQK